MSLPLPRRVLAAPLLVGALGIGAGACGGSATPTAVASQPVTAAPAAGGTGAAAGFNGALGTVAAVSGSSPVVLEVQNPRAGQTTVTVGSAATVLRQVAANASAVTVGDCVQVTAVQPASTAAGAASATSGAVSAATVTVTPAGSSGRCGVVGSFRGAARSGGFFRAAGRSPRPRPSGTAGRRRFTGERAVAGSVASVSGSTFVVDARRPLPTSSAVGTTPSAAPSFTTTPVTVQETSATRYLVTEAATPSVLAVGQCVIATGSTDSTGAVTARLVEIRLLSGSTPCVPTFGAGGAGGAVGGAAASGGAASGG